MQTTLNLRYTGPSVDDGRMDVYQASANMIAFSEFVVAASKSVFGEQVRTTAQVAGFARGSFTTQMMFEYVGPLASLFSGISPDQVFTVIKEAFEVWKHLKGEPPQKPGRPVRLVGRAPWTAEHPLGQARLLRTHRPYAAYVRSGGGVARGRSG